MEETKDVEFITSSTGAVFTPDPETSIVVDDILGGDPTSTEGVLEEIVQEETPYGVPTEEQLNKINTFTKRKLTKDEVFVTSAKFIGNGLLEERGIKLDESLLHVFLKDAKSGISFMLDHPWAGFFAKPKPAYSYGRTFDAVLVESENSIATDETKAIYGDIYIVRGKEKDGISTDEIIKDIEDGTLFDVSIGFSFKTAECSICGGSIYECKHYPGLEYKVEDKMKTCYVIAKPPGYLMEISGVFDGAYPTAGFSQGDYEPAWVEIANIKDTPKGSDVVFTYSSRFGFKAFSKNEPKIDKAIDVARAESIAGANWEEDLYKLAIEGGELRKDLIEDSLAWGVRAMGNAFNRDLHEKLFEKSSISEIKEFRDQFIQKAKEEIPTGRLVKPSKGVTGGVPVGAFRRKELM